MGFVLQNDWIHFRNLNIKRLILDLDNALEFEDVLEQEVHQAYRGLILNLLILLAYFRIFLLHIQLRSICLFICALILIVLAEVGIILRQELVLNSLELLALLSSIRSLRHHLLLAQRNVEQIEQSQIHLWVDHELAIFLQDAQNAQFPVKYEILVSLDQYVCDRHDTVFQCFDLQFLEQLWSGNLFAGCLDARID